MDHVVCANCGKPEGDHHSFVPGGLDEDVTISVTWRKKRYSRTCHLRWMQGRWEGSFTQGSGSYWVRSSTRARVVNELRAVFRMDVRRGPINFGDNR